MILKYFYFFILPTFFLVLGLRLVLVKSSLPKRTLGIYFLVFFIRMLSAYFLEETHFDFSIHFYKIQSIIFYIVPPLGFLFVLYALKPDRQFRELDLLHFLPAVIHFAELVPFLFGPVELKLKDLAIAKSTPNFSYDYATIAGFIPPKIHFYVKLVSHLVYYSYGGMIWFRYAKYSQSIFYKNNRILIRWIGFDVVLKFVSLVAILSKGLNLYKSFAFQFSASDFFLLLDGVFHFAFFLLYPNLLNGAFFEKLNWGIRTNENEIPALANTIKKQLRELQLIMEVDAPFLDENFTIRKLADLMKINERNLSKLIHEQYGMTFPDFVGKWRLNYLKKMHETNELGAHISIEKMAETSGFGSRQALYKVVQRLYNMTPNQYFESINPTK
jgi:AraC-like DNA-binding protein